MTYKYMAEFNRRRLCTPQSNLIVGVLLGLLCLPNLYGQVSFSEIEALEYDEPNETIQYGKNEHQFAEYWHPATLEPALVVLIHGGCWLNEYGLDHVRALASALKRSGYAVWSTEYRRVGDAGGGWPGTFDDIADSINHTKSLPNVNQGARFLIGHSAGGHLALWASAKESFPPDSPFYRRIKTDIHGAIGLAAISNVIEYSSGKNSCEIVTEKLMGGAANALVDRYAYASPLALLPSSNAILIHGESDTIVNISQSERFAESASNADLVRLPGLGHFDMIDPNGLAFESIIAALRRLEAEVPE